MKILWYKGIHVTYLPTKHHLHYLLYKNWTQKVCLCLRECLMAGFYLSCSTLSFHIGDRFSSCLNFGREIEASEAAEITPRNRLHFFCTERTVKRPESMFAAARTEELTAVGTIDAHQFPGILLPAPLWWIAIFCKHISGQKKDAQEWPWCRFSVCWGEWLVSELGMLQIPCFLCAATVKWSHQLSEHSASPKSNACVSDIHSCICTVALSKEHANCFT